MTKAPRGLAKRSLTIAGHRTSVSLEPAFWQALASLAQRRGMSVPALVAAVDEARGSGNLSSALRVHILEAVAEAHPPGAPD